MNQDQIGKRICETTGLPICLDAQFFIKCNAVLGVVFLLIGGFVFWRILAAHRNQPLDEDPAS